MNKPSVAPVTNKLHSSQSELALCAGSSPIRVVLELCKKICNHSTKKIIFIITRPAGQEKHVFYTIRTLFIETRRVKDILSILNSASIQKTHPVTKKMSYSSNC